MTGLTSQEETHLAELLERLGQVLDDLRPNERNFVEDQIKRYEEYKANIRVSPRQISWLESLDARYS